jgi:2-polyprenyl-3-methyl-5-hydroxy-6-metoxy-1,4-benzoquinol methylase
MSDMPRCRLCGGRHLSHFLSLKELPISHYLRKKPQDPDPRFTVDFESCQDCGLLQIVNAIPADLIYDEADTYTTGFQRPRHLDDLITTAIARQDPAKAIDVGCNDGTLMENLRRAGYRQVVGVEPNAVAAELARKKGYDVYTSYLTDAQAQQIVAKHGKFDTVFLRHVVEHVSDLDGFFAGIRTLLRDDGLLVLELPEVEESFRLGSPAILWEEHVNYFTPALAEHMLRRFGFDICDRRSYVFGGGSMAFVARMQTLPIACAVKVPDPGPTIELLRRFAGGIERQKAELNGLVSLARSNGFQVAVYGAAPRSCLLASVCQIADKIDFVIDDRQDIQNRLMPGTPNAVRPLAEVAGVVGAKLLCLLGVGSENEFKVRTRIEEAVSAEVAYVSLFPPRDMLQSVDAARRAITASQK